MNKLNLDIDHARERMLTFGLVHAADQLDPFLSEPVRLGTAPHAFLDQLLEAEYQGRGAACPYGLAPVEPPDRPHTG